MTDDDYHARAQQHRPTDRRGFIASAVQMRGQGLKPDDIALLLHLTRAAVLDLLCEADTGSERFPSNR